MVYRLYRISRVLYEKKLIFLAHFIYSCMRILFATVIPYKAVIGAGTEFGYKGLGTVINKKAVIGQNCLISQCVTIGGTRHFYISDDSNASLLTGESNNGKLSAPLIGNNVYIGAGAQIIGGIRIGDGAVIGANAVVNKDVPPYSLAVGVPARVIKTITISYNGVKAYTANE